jgi:glycosyltransferase involved in cell wall biosynthesis
MASVDVRTVSERELPFYSIVIPTRQRFRPLERCLHAIEASDYPSSRFEVIVVDDGGCGGSALDGILRPLRGRLEIHVRKTPGLGPAGARNAGSKDAAGEVLAFIDDDCLVHSACIRALCSALGASPRKAAGGRTVNGLRENRWSAASQQITDLVFAFYNANPAQATLLTANCLAVPTEGFWDIGGFDERYRTAEDRDFCWRWLASNRDAIYEPEALVYHEDAVATFAGYCQRYFNYGRGAYRFHAAAARDGRPRNMLGFYASMPRFLSAMAGDNDNGGSAGRAAFTADLAVWQAANAVGFAWEAARTAVRCVQ